MRFDPYLGMWPCRIRTLRRSDRPPALHQQTCPAFGRTLANIYKRDGTWMPPVLGGGSEQ